MGTTYMSLLKRRAIGRIEQEHKERVPACICAETELFKYYLRCDGMYGLPTDRPDILVRYSGSEISQKIT